MVDFGAWLRQHGGAPLLVVRRSLLVWLGHCLDVSGVWERASTDAFTDAPMLRGAKRQRRVEPALQDAIARTAGEGEVARSGAAALWVAEHMRRINASRKKGGFANRFLQLRCKKYWEQMQSKFAGGPAGVISLAVDASRMGQRDCLYAAVYSPSKAEAYCPPRQPVAGKLQIGTPKRAFSNFEKCKKI